MVPWQPPGVTRPRRRAEPVGVEGDAVGEPEPGGELRAIPGGEKYLSTLVTPPTVPDEA